MQSGPALLERAAGARARLLRAARFGPTGVGLALTFDAGLVLVELDAEGGGGLSITHPEEGAALPPALESADEEEPWWRLLGSPLTAATPVRDGTFVREIRLHFGEPSDGSRVVTLAPRGANLVATLEAA